MAFYFMLHGSIGNVTKTDLLCTYVEWRSISGQIYCALMWNGVLFRQPRAESIRTRSKERSCAPMNAMLLR